MMLKNEPTIMLLRDMLKKLMLKNYDDKKLGWVVTDQQIPNFGPFFLNISPLVVLLLENRKNAIPSL